MAYRISEAREGVLTQKLIVSFKVFVNALVRAIDYVHGEIDDIPHELGGGRYFGSFTPFSFEVVGALGLEAGQRS